MQESTEHSPALANLSMSIWDAYEGTRLEAATYSEMLPAEQLEHPHLTTDSSPEDVVSYIDMLLGVLS